MGEASTTNTRVSAGVLSVDRIERDVIADSDVTGSRPLHIVEDERSTTALSAFLSCDIYFCVSLSGLPGQRSSSSSFFDPICQRFSHRRGEPFDCQMWADAILIIECKSTSLYTTNKLRTLRFLNVNLRVARFTRHPCHTLPQTFHLRSRGTRLKAYTLVQCGIEAANAVVGDTTTTPRSDGLTCRPRRRASFT
ncbi:hypothetical protein EVAR_11259_1 [Eumeta japonica]|uniref:Uncharacterized protein n=1 Tax=Eumeta variegata TaxID=151549 RepID=A0A4C1UMC8_EUMVA|nr:hypothetical protein EVAR_11259_1 [Eumeta japonica]